ncbi:MAG: response regulator [Myxococcota bacterium]
MGLPLPTPVLAPRPRVLLAEDENVTRRLLEAQMTRFGFEVVSVSDGLKAWEVLQGPNAPSLVVLDWNMPGLDGPEICRKIRETPRDGYTYTLLVTARNAKSDVVEGLSAGADDFISKPVEPDELHARLRTGERIVRLEQTLAQQVKELREAAEHVQELQGMIPICMHCKRIRNQSQIWEKVETYIEHRSGAKFSHALCSECLEQYYPDTDAPHDHDHEHEHDQAPAPGNSPPDE